MIIEEEFNASLACAYIAFALFFILAIISIPIWPDWLFKMVFNGGLKVAIPLFGFLLARFVLWYIPYHFGVSIWILPNIFYLKNMVSPVAEF
jgi:hypothetical protein